MTFPFPVFCPSAVAASYRYYKWVVTAVQNSTNVAIDEVEIFDGSNVNLIPDMTTNTTGGVTMTATGDIGNGSNFEDWMAGDRATTYWISDGGPPETLKVDFGSPIVTHKYTITAPSLNGAHIYAPKTFTFEGSNDDSNWTVLDTRASLANWTSGEKRTFTF